MNETPKDKALVYSMLNFFLVRGVYSGVSPPLRGGEKKSKIQKQGREIKRKEKGKKKKRRKNGKKGEKREKKKEKRGKNRK